MILSKKFECTVDDLDSVIVAVAKEIENGWHISKIDTYGLTMCCSIKRTEPDFSIELVRKDRY
jgi:hypothetical protein